MIISFFKGKKFFIKRTWFLMEETILKSWQFHYLLLHELYPLRKMLFAKFCLQWRGTLWQVVNVFLPHVFHYYIPLEKSVSLEWNKFESFTIRKSFAEIG